MLSMLSWQKPSVDPSTDEFIPETPKEFEGVTLFIPTNLSKANPRYYLVCVDKWGSFSMVASASKSTVIKNHKPGALMLPYRFGEEYKLRQKADIIIREIRARAQKSQPYLIV